MNLENEFIPYEQALALKELGFDEPCFMTYLNGKLDKELFLFNHSIRSHSTQEFTSAPTFSQVFRWFREKYDLFTQDFIDLDNKFTKNIVKVLKNGQDFFYLDYYKTYEEAELECLKKLIEIIKNKKLKNE